MPVKTKKGKEFERVRSVFFFSLILLLGIGILYIIRPFLYPIFWAAILAILFYPVYRFLRNWPNTQVLLQFCQS